MHETKPVFWGVELFRCAFASRYLLAGGAAESELPSLPPARDVLDCIFIDGHLALLVLRAELLLASRNGVVKRRALEVPEPFVGAFRPEAHLCESLVIHYFDQRALAFTYVIGLPSFETIRGAPSPGYAMSWAAGGGHVLSRVSPKNGDFRLENHLGESLELPDVVLAELSRGAVPLWVEDACCHIALSVNGGWTVKVYDLEGNIVDLIRRALNTPGESWYSWGLAEAGGSSLIITRRKSQAIIDIEDPPGWVCCRKDGSRFLKVANSGRHETIAVNARKLAAEEIGHVRWARAALAPMAPETCDATEPLPLFALRNFLEEDAEAIWCRLNEDAWYA